jgi:hypothetical protein
MMMLNVHHYLFTYKSVLEYISLMQFLLNNLLFGAENNSGETKTCILKWNCVH